MRRFFPFAALLGVAFVLGCQDLGTVSGAAGGGGVQPEVIGGLVGEGCGQRGHHPVAEALDCGQRSVQRIA